MGKTETTICIGSTRQGTYFDSQGYDSYICQGLNKFSLIVVVKEVVIGI